MFDLIPFEHRNNDLFNLFDKWGNDFFSGFDKDLIAPCRADIIDNGGHYTMKSDMPGFNKEDIHIDINGDQLTISAEHNEEKSDEDKKQNYVRRERRYGSLSRSFDISGIEADKITASYENGVLTLELPKKAESQPAARQVEIH